VAFVSIDLLGSPQIFVKKTVESALDSWYAGRKQHV